jgi:D-3-phosphoglycerate dehydrogenase
MIVGDAAQPSELTVSAVRALLHPSTRYSCHDWQDEGAVFSSAALAAERGHLEAPPDSWLDTLREADVLITHFFPVGLEVLDLAKRVRILATLRHGEENLDRQLAESRGIVVLNNPGREAEAVSDFTVAAILAQLRGLFRATSAMHAGRWIAASELVTSARDPAAVVIGVVGFGHVGRLVTRKLTALGCHLLVHDPFVASEEIEDAGAVAAPLDELLSGSDVVTLHLRLSNESRGLIGARELALMRTTAVLVNTARAELVEEAALVTSLRNGRLGGAVLDVFWEEPLPATHPLVGMDNVVLTPHIAGSSAESQRNSATLLAGRLASVIAERGFAE